MADVFSFFNANILRIYYIFRFNKNELTTKACEFTQKHKSFFANERAYDSIIVVTDVSRYEEISRRPKDCFPMIIFIF